MPVENGCVERLGPIEVEDVQREPDGRTGFQDAVCRHIEVENGHGVRCFEELVKEEKSVMINLGGRGTREEGRGEGSECLDDGKEGCRALSDGCWTAIQSKSELQTVK